MEKRAIAEDGGAKLPNPRDIIRKLKLKGGGISEKNPRMVAQALEGKKRPQAIIALKEMFGEAEIDRIIKEING